MPRWSKAALRNLQRECLDAMESLNKEMTPGYVLLLLRNIAVIRQFPAKMQAATRADILVRDVTAAVTHPDDHTVEWAASCIDLERLKAEVYSRAAIGYGTECDDPRADSAMSDVVELAAAATFFPEEERRKTEADLAEVLSVMAAQPGVFKGAWSYATWFAKHRPLTGVSPFLDAVVREAQVRA